MFEILLGYLAKSTFKCSQIDFFGNSGMGVINLCKRRGVEAHQSHEGRIFQLGLER